jgi:hypothetical protein
MGKSKSFKPAGDTGVTVFASDASGNSIPVRLEPGETFETSDEHIVAALEGSSEVTSSSSSSESKESRK